MKINTGTVARPDEKSEKGGRLLADVARRRSSIEMETRRASGFRSVKWLFLSFACSFPNDNDDDERPPWLRRFHPLPMRSPAKKDRYRINDRHQIPEGYCSCYPFNISPSLFLFFFFVLFFFLFFKVISCLVIYRAYIAASSGCITRASTRLFTWQLICRGLLAVMAIERRAKLIKVGKR